MNEKAEEYSYPYKITILCTGGAVSDLVPLLEKCRVAGAVGHTMQIVTDPDMREAQEQFLFDGDGASGIKGITVSRLHWKKLRNLHTQNGVLNDWEGAWISEEERVKRMRASRKDEGKSCVCEADRNESPSEGSST